MTDFLDDEANRPASSILDRMMEEAKAKGFTADAPKRPRGRPRGSPNRSKLVTPPGTTTTTSGTQPSGAREPDPAQVRAAKAARAEELAAKVGDTINDNIMLILSSMGVPSHLLYQPGKEPQQQAANNKYTQMGNMVAISPMQANLYGKFLAEAEATDLGKKLTGTAGPSNGPLVIYGLLSLAATVQYVKSLQQFSQRLKPLLDAYAEQMRQQAEQARTDIPQTNGQRV